MKGIGLVLQGGGTRGIYTAGVLDFFLDKGLNFPYVIGVSAGSCIGATYIAQQRGLGKTIHTKYIRDRRYMGLNSLVKNGCYFNMDFIFEEIPKNLESFDYDAFRQSPTEFWVVTTNCHTGQPEYFNKKECQDIFKVIRASCSLPFLSKRVAFADAELLDGGIVDPIPIDKSIKDGNQKNVVIMTDSMAYKTKATGLTWLAGKMYSAYEELCESIHCKHQVHNQAIETLKTLQSKKEAFIIEPSKHINIKALGRDKAKLTRLYDLGYEDAQNSYDLLVDWLNVKGQQEPSIQHKVLL